MLNRIILLTVIVLTSYTANGKTTRYVEADGTNENNDCSNPMFPCGSVKVAVAQSQGGDLISIGGGAYTESEIVIDKDLQLEGTLGTTTVQAAWTLEQSTNRVFHIKEDTNVVLKDLIIRHGKTRDGKSKSKDHRTDPQLGEDGGGILNEGALTILNCGIQNNTTGEGTAGYYGRAGGYSEQRPGGSGGGIHNKGRLDIRNSSLLNNTTGSKGDGAGICNTGILHIEDVRFTGNTTGAFGKGGAIANTGTLSVNASIIENNQTGEDEGGAGGGIFNSNSLECLNSSIVFNIAGEGGGILNTGEATVQHCAVENNAANRPGGTESLYGGNGGGINNQGALDVRSSSISKNISGSSKFAGSGGGISNNRQAFLSIMNCLIHQNDTGTGYVAGHGGGIENQGEAIILNSTITMNGTGLKALSGVSGKGAGIRNAGELLMSHSTVAFNRIGEDGFKETAKGAGIMSDEGTLTLSHCIVAHNTLSQGDTAFDCFGVIDSNGYNLIMEDQGCTVEGIEVGNMVGADPLLDTLKNNGGPTLTHALLAGSPAINAGDPLINNPPEFDQRGEARITGSRIDLGAYEADVKGFTAYNDFSWGLGQVAKNITLFTTATGKGSPPNGSSGLLVDYHSGMESSVRLTVGGGSWDGDRHVRFGTSSKPGTEGYDIFNGIVDTAGVLSYGSSPITLSFSGLDPDLLYEVVLFSNRHNPSYRDRVSTTKISGIASFKNASSVGAQFHGTHDESTRIQSGFNTEDGLRNKILKN